MPRLTGLNAVVTGGTRGLGLSMSRSLAAAGANVVINGRTAEACRRAIDAVGRQPGSVDYVAGSIDEETIAQALIERCGDAFGPVGFVVNNAGITRDKSLMNMTIEDFDEVVAVHLRGTWLMCRAAARAMKGSGGTILNVTSGSALYGLVGQSNYAAAKGGVIALTRALSVELARYSVRVNALYPVALTDMTAPVLELSGGADGRLSGVFGDPDHVAKLVVMLADSSIALSGQILGFDGAELAVWSHPDQLYSISHSAPWTEDQLHQALEAVAARPAELHPDAVGLRTRAALQRPGR